MVEYSNTFDLLPAVERQHLLDTRAVLNQTFMDMSLDDLQKRFFVASHPEDGIFLWDDVWKKRVGYVSFDIIKDNTLFIKTYGVLPVYQKYGFSTLLLGGLIGSRALISIQNQYSGQPITSLSFCTKQLKPHITEQSYKYFDISDNTLSNPDMDAIWRSVFQKIQSPHLDFNSGTDQVHIGRYALDFDN